MSLFRSLAGMSGLGSGEPSDAAMARNTSALLAWLGARPPTLAQLPGPGPAGAPHRGGLVGEEDFVAWAVATVGSLGAPGKLPDLLFKFNALEADE